MPVVSRAQVMDYVLKKRVRRAKKSEEKIYRKIPNLEIEDCSKVVIVVPHPDDETIACSGIIQRALKLGIKVKIILVSSGGAKKFVLGKKSKRVKEFRQAIKLYGLNRKDVFVLDYRDGRISKFQDSLKKDLEEIFPSLVNSKSLLIFPSMHEMNKDHKAISHVVSELLSRTISRKVLGAMKYLVHYKNFPRPYIFAPELYLIPPKKLLCENWIKFPLEKNERTLKYKAMLIYKSQLKVPLLKRTLLSFIRKNELFHF